MVKDAATEIPYGYCQCGCGQKTKVVTCNSKARGWIKGEPIRFIGGHHHNHRKGENHHNWNGGKIKDSSGYVLVSMPSHPRRDKRGYVFEHILVAEKILGKPLPLGAIPHHVNSIKDDNRPDNLVICQDRAYHNLLHQRQLALIACGHADWLKCKFCQTYDNPNNLYVRPNSNSGWHRNCKNQMNYNGPIILVDSREQLPYSFNGLVPPSAIKIAGLNAGDYSIDGYQDQISIERKSLIDAFGTFGAGRKRFERELEKLAKMKYAAVIIESDWDTIVLRPPARSQLPPKTMVSSVAAWSQRYQVHFWTCPNRAFAEKYTFRLLERFWKDREKEKHGK